ncbi:MAG: hypothetical protein GF411_19980 [Candidatus Lokiarchaeota archaeon]|nr:hypothetical protein [Candidatus Lokiarchaeota archaeon]
MIEKTLREHAERHLDEIDVDKSGQFHDRIKCPVCNSESSLSVNVSKDGFTYGYCTECLRGWNNW